MSLSEGKERKDVKLISTINTIKSSQQCRTMETSIGKRYADRSIIYGYV